MHILYREEGENRFREAFILEHEHKGEFDKFTSNQWVAGPSLRVLSLALHSFKNLKRS